MHFLPAVSLEGCEDFGEFCCGSCRGVRGDGSAIGEQQPWGRGKGAAGLVPQVQEGLCPFCPPKLSQRGQRV